MEKASLTQDEIKSYQFNGVTKADCLPFTVAQFAALKKLVYETIEKEFQPSQSGCVFKLFNRHPDFINYAAENSLLDLVEALIGPNICLVGSSLFLKRAGSPKYASWHSDFGQEFEMFDKMEVLSTTVAVTPSTKSNGCIRYLPQSHHQIFRLYTSKNYENSLFGSRSFLLEDSEIDLSKGVIDMELAAGQCSFNNLNTLHSSQPNTSNEDRVLINFKFMSPDSGNGTDAARALFKSNVKNRILVRGTDKDGFCNL